MEYRETFAPTPVTVAGVTIAVEVSLSIEVWELGSGIRKPRNDNAVAGRVHAEPKRIRITTGDETVTLAL